MISATISYSAWLDAGMTYSSAICAEADPADEPLERPSARKLRRLALDPLDQARRRLLDIGCGWGSLAEAAARDWSRVPGLTLSE